MAVLGINSKEHQKVEGVDDDKEEEYNIGGDESPFWPPLLDVCGDHRMTQNVECNLARCL